MTRPKVDDWIFCTSAEIGRTRTDRGAQTDGAPHPQPNWRTKGVPFTRTGRRFLCSPGALAMVREIQAGGEQ